MTIVKCQMVGNADIFCLRRTMWIGLHSVCAVSNCCLFLWLTIGWLREGLVLRILESHVGNLQLPAPRKCLTDDDADCCGMCLLADWCKAFGEDRPRHRKSIC